MRENAAGACALAREPLTVLSWCSPPSWAWCFAVAV